MSSSKIYIIFKLRCARPSKFICTGTIKSLLLDVLIISNATTLPVITLQTSIRTPFPYTHLYKCSLLSFPHTDASIIEKEGRHRIYEKVREVMSELAGENNEVAGVDTKKREREEGFENQTHVVETHSQIRSTCITVIQGQLSLQSRNIVDDRFVVNSFSDCPFNTVLPLAGLTTRADTIGRQNLDHSSCLM